MEFSLIKNGADSLKKAKTSIDLFNNIVEEYAYHHLKDATIYLNHAIEVLMKHILITNNESLIFKDLKKYTEAKKELLNKYSGQIKITNGFGYLPNSKYTVFDVPKGKQLQTIGIDIAIERIKYFCDIEMTDTFENGIFFINDYRNKITHHSIIIHTQEEKDKYVRTLVNLYDEALNFFDIHVPGLLEIVDQQRFEISKEEWEDYQRDMADYYYERSMSKIL